MTTFFVSGHLDLTEREFESHYAKPISEALSKGGAFVVGDARGCDTMAQEYLRRRRSSVTVFHMFTSPRNNVGGFCTFGGFTSDEERDAEMTQRSDADIAWVRPGREKSGTAKNLQRRLEANG